MEQRYIKLSEYAKINSITYKTAYLHWVNGIIAGKQLSTGTILINEISENVVNESRVATYARVSSSENKLNLDTQSDRLVSYANAKGYKVSKIVKEIGSGLNDNRPKLFDLLNDDSINIILVEHKDRFSRFGLNYIKLLLEKQGRKLEIINEVNNDTEDIMEDFVSIITSFCAKIYGKRRSKRNTEKLIQDLSTND
jgi:predicted site-specific integrase-resolvase